MNWLQTIIGAGLGSALIQGLAPVWKERLQRRKHATFLSMKLAVLLEAYGAACHDFVVEHMHAETPPESEYPDYNLNLPELPPLPDDDDGWRAIDAIVAADCMGLPNKIASKRTDIRWTMEFAEDELDRVLRQSAAVLGCEAWRIAKELRRKNGLMEATGVNYEALLHENLKQVLDENAVRADRPTLSGNVL